MIITNLREAETDPGSLWFQITRYKTQSQREVRCALTEVCSNGNTGRSCGSLGNDDVNCRSFAHGLTRFSHLRGVEEYR